MYRQVLPRLIPHRLKRKVTSCKEYVLLHPFAVGGMLRGMSQIHT